MHIPVILKKYKRPIGATVVLVPTAIILFTIFCSYIIGQNQQYITSLDSAQHTKVGIVLGAGISKDGKPYDELKARLDVAKQALDQGVVDRLILSGDNRYKNYDEPTAMKNYLIDKGVPSDVLIADYAGRSTYESCERASKIFDLHETIIFSAESHLPRAIYLCRHFGISAQGISSGVEANNSGRREPLARVKAMYNAHLIGERTVLGDPISIN